MKYLLLIVLALAFVALSSCSSTPVVPAAKNVKVSRDDADKDCREIGPVQGTVQTKSGTIEEAIEDMKLDAARKGANYVRMETTSSYGTSSQGTAYYCP
jgi:hypothetical protein